MQVKDDNAGSCTSNQDSATNEECVPPRDLTSSAKSDVRSIDSLGRYVEVRGYRLRCPVLETRRKLSVVYEDCGHLKRALLYKARTGGRINAAAQKNRRGMLSSRRLCAWHRLFCHDSNRMFNEIGWPDATGNCCMDRKLRASETSTRSVSTKRGPCVGVQFQCRKDLRNIGLKMV